ncbi:MFS transporter [Gilliamella apicola]|uniref:MFS transporter n=1 Tax=Gilliamella apicola TaxID=1196095 RepID=A0A242NDH8_9GAMM|nr:MFS transporter [Gilliamella apicola]OTP81239.1 hypothetical protein B5S40_12485 [Gilliamella apicola]OTP83066.1 hypothetical protein B5S44_12815 [Gilliamella apicola]OTP87146.1 hypothetical protein B5S42_11215 [Gilliamella apicola]OTP97779.1 hypothetical protein B6D08_13535 [Gilliamella apicola]OTQ08793.1 hypothetical protein B6D11_13870 [Gilliamella apicola]
MDNKNTSSNRRPYFLFLIAQLYIIQGIPVGLAFDAYPILLRDAGVSLAIIAIIPLAGIPWVVKFLWAPLVENYWLDKIGYRKSWLLPMQFLLAILIAVIAFTPFTEDTTSQLIGIIILSCIISATQDIATDGLAADLAQTNNITQINSIQVMGNIAGMLIGGAGVSICYDCIGKTYSILLLVVIIIFSIVQLLLWKEPKLFYTSEPKPRAKISLFFKRPKAYSMLLLALLIPFAGSVILTMSKLILLDRGLSVSDVGLYTGIGGYLTMILGCILAAYLLKKHPPSYTLKLGFSLLASLAFSWSVLNYYPSYINPVTVMISMTLLGIGIGFINVSIYTFTMIYAKQSKQTATDYAVFQSTLLLSEIIGSSLSMTLAEYFNYFVAFLSALIAIIAIFVLNKKYLKLFT